MIDNLPAIPWTISVIVPVYYSEGTLRELVRQLSEVLANLTDTHEITLVNDGSRDLSWATLSQIADQMGDFIRMIDLMRNYGQHNALLAGIRAARYSTIVTIDDDLQHPPGEIPNLLAQVLAGYDVVYGTLRQEQHGLWRDLALRIAKSVLQGAMGAETARSVSALRAFRTDIRSAFSRYDSPFVNIDVM